MEDRYQLAILENCLGITAGEVYNNLIFADGEMKSLQICMFRLEQQIVGQINETWKDRPTCSIVAFKTTNQLICTSMTCATWQETTNYPSVCTIRCCGNGNQSQRHGDETVTDHTYFFAADCKQLQGGGSN